MSLQVREPKRLGEDKCIMGEREGVTHYLHKIIKSASEGAKEAGGG